MQNYSPTQTVFSLSMYSTLGSGLNGTVDQIESATLKRITTDLELASVIADIGTWSVIWGPAVYQAPASNVADNVMVVFQAGADATVPGQLVVGIAGTNPYSAFDWIVEDFLVSSAVPWPYGNPGSLNPKISLGTAIGLSILQSLMPGPGLPGVGTLTSFLQSTLNAPTPISVTGHSLGGALSPAVALWLSDTKAQWDPSGRSSLACLPSAGPTSGDQAFATYYGSQLESVTTRLYNSLDVVPHAWESDDLLKLPELYNPPISPTLEIFRLLVAALAITAEKDYTQICKSTPPLQGALNQSLIKPANSDCDNYTAQMVYQHVEAYFGLLGIAVSPSLNAALAPAANDQLARLVSTARRKLHIRRRSKTPLA